MNRYDGSPIAAVLRAAGASLGPRLATVSDNLRPDEAARYTDHRDATAEQRRQRERQRERENGEGWVSWMD